MPAHSLPVASASSIAMELPLRRELTPFGWLVVIEGLVLVSSRWWPATALPEPAVMALGVALLAAVGLAWYLTPRSCAEVRGRWSVALRIPVGDEVAVGAVLDAPAGLPPCTVAAFDPAVRRLRDAVRLRSHPAGIIRYSWAARFPRRGVVQLPPLEIRCSQPFGVVAVRRTIGTGQEVVVLPGLGRMRRQLRQRLDAWLADATPTRDLGVDEPDHLRAYRPGDALRSVHWRASARHGDLLVAQRNDVGAQRVAVLLDTSGRATGGGVLPGRAFETLVCAAATLADALLQRGCEVAVHGGFAPRGVVAQAGSAASTVSEVSDQRQRLLEALAVARIDGVPLDDLVPAVPLVLIITARADAVPPFTPAPLVLALDGIDAVLRLPRRLRSADKSSAGRLSAGTVRDEGDER